jgi:hypothetical protein
VAPQSSSSSNRRPPRWLLIALVLVFLPVILLLAAVFAFCWAIAAAGLTVAVWIAWLPRGRRFLVVYSDSPIWKTWFEQRAVPTLGSEAAVLNWSERTRWKPSLAVWLFRVFGGSRNYNPLIIVFDPLPRTFRFYVPFRDYKHGRPQSVERLWSECLGYQRQTIQRSGSSVSSDPQ